MLRRYLDGNHILDFLEKRQGRKDLLGKKLDEFVRYSVVNLTVLFILYTKELFCVL